MTLMFPIFLFLVALGLSALFSGTETGFYRVSRLRLQVLAGTGDWVGRILVTLAERPALFISTTLVGNNLANYLVSMATVLVFQQLAQTSSTTIELLATLVATPIVFIFGELIPKRLFLQAPFRLLKITGPVFSVLALLLLPLSIILWLYGRILSLFIPASPESARSEIASRELRRILEEGEHAGLIVAIQRQIARAILTHGPRPVAQFMRQLSSFPRISGEQTWSNLSWPLQSEPEEFVLVHEKSNTERILGYAFVPDLIFHPDLPAGSFVRPVFRIQAEEKLVSVIQRLFQQKEPVALVVDTRGRPLGVLLERDLRRIYLEECRA